ncbi:MAG: hypothetical protein PHT78_11025 [Desulfitobacteriaceae bacterium]|nr:hypothetical protein [Desulfitobacteriaceae bacterium]
MESGIYIAKIARVVVFAYGINSSGNKWIIFLLTLDISIDGKKHSISYRQPSWTFADIYAGNFGTTKNDFTNWCELRGEFVHVYLQAYEDPKIIEFV